MSRSASPLPNHSQIQGSSSTSNILSGPCTLATSVKRSWQEGDRDSREEEAISTHDSSGPGKRARYDEDVICNSEGSDDNVPADQHLKVLSKTPERDATYYLLDGSCVLLVENTLFNVHRTILSKDASSFRDMFSLPQALTSDSFPSDGASDVNPIVLTGDTPAQFRNFLWALYAMPHELMVVHTPRADLVQLMDIAETSHKYSFKSLETWSLDALQEFISRKPSPLLNPVPATSYTFSPFRSMAHDCAMKPAKPNAQEAQEGAMRVTKLVRLAQLCGHDRLLVTMINVLRQLMLLNLHYAYLAMTLADELDLKTLRGSAYLEVLSKTTVVPQCMALAWVAVGGKKDIRGADSADLPVAKEEQEDEEDMPLLTSSQRLRLLSGYYCLTNAWDHLRTHPPSFEHAPTCGATWNQPGCTQSWVDFWKEKTRGEGVVGLGLSDVLGRLRAVQKEFDRWGSATYMHHDCRMSARRGLVECIRRIEDSLPSYFE
ncbi:hypothetical protein HWV62_195 [Athelia sp. TMB]|nr:hypothetical protein HWV62_195 [Athelia sp. TMB]